MNDFVISLDTEIFLFLNSFHSLYWDRVMQMISGKFTWSIMYLALIYSLWRSFGWKTMVIMCLMIILTVTLADQVSASLLRPYFERLRPAHPENPISELVHVVDGYRGGRYGFPSCHAANTFSVWTLMSLLFRHRRFTVAMLVWALLICYSRINLGVHYPGDLLVGAIIGCISGLLCFILGSMLVRMWKGTLPTRRRDIIITTTLDGKRLRYRPDDIMICLEALTILFTLVLATAIS